jgi:hypothetical protein
MTGGEKMGEKKKTLYDYKLGEMAPLGEMGELMGSEKGKLVKIGYTYQTEDAQMECALKHPDFREEGE